MVGTVSRTARVSVARRNLKEAAGKILARRTGIAYEACISGREGTTLQSPITIHEDMSVDAAGIWDEGRAHYPGRSVVLHRWKHRCVGVGNNLPYDRQKSAEAIVVGLTTRRRAEHVESARSLHFDVVVKGRSLG